MLPSTSSEAEKILDQRPEVDLIVLDWIMKEEDTEAKGLLLSLQKKIFAPIIVYTDKGIEGPSGFIKDNNLGRIVRVLDKGSVKGDKVLNELDKWLTQNPELKIFLRWARNVESKLNQALWTIHNLDVGGIRAIINMLDPEEGVAHDTQEADLENFFTRILTRKLEKDDGLIALIRKDIEALPKQEKIPKKEPKKEEALEEGKSKAGLDKIRTFHSFERYKQANPKCLSTGGILRTRAGKFFVVVTPLCDLSHESKIENVLMLKAESLEKYVSDRPGISENTIKSCVRNGAGYVHFLPYAADLKDGLVCRFDHMCTISEKQLRKNLENESITCVAIVDSPFVQNLVQRLTSYLMRLGVRDISESEIQNLAVPKSVVAKPVEVSK